MPDHYNMVILWFLKMPFIGDKVASHLLQIKHSYMDCAEKAHVPELDSLEEELEDDIRWAQEVKFGKF